MRGLLGALGVSRMLSRCKFVIKSAKKLTTQIILRENAPIRASGCAPRCRAGRAPSPAQRFIVFFQPRSLTFRLVSVEKLLHTWRFLSTKFGLHEISRDCPSAASLASCASRVWARTPWRNPRNPRSARIRDSLFPRVPPEVEFPTLCVLGSEGGKERKKERKRERESLPFSVAHQTWASDGLSSWRTQAHRWRSSSPSPSDASAPLSMT